MTPHESFCWWLQGYLIKSERTRTFDLDDMKRIRGVLDEALYSSTDTYEPDRKDSGQ